MKNSEAVKDINYYLSLPYTIVLRTDGEGDVVARIDELPGCVAHGKSNLEALDELESMKKLWIEDCLEGGETVPEPEGEESLPSGKWVQRVPRTLHGKLARAAKQDGVSLNQLVTSMLSEQYSAREIQKSVERIVVEHFSAPQRSYGGYYWTTDQPPRHYWDFGPSLSCGSLGMPDTHTIGRWRTVGNLIPQILELKVDNENEITPKDLFAGRR